MDQGTNFMARVMSRVCEVLRIKHLRTLVYHPRIDRLVEHFNHTLKSLLKKTIQGDPKKWDKLLVPLVFAIGEVPQASTVPLLS